MAADVFVTYDDMSSVVIKGTEQARLKRVVMTYGVTRANTLKVKPADV